jgi:hypothetical protein
MISDVFNRFIYSVNAYVIISQSVNNIIVKSSSLDGGIRFKDWTILV